MRKKLLSGKTAAPSVAGSMLKKFVRISAFWLTPILFCTNAAAQLQLLKDIGREEQLGYNEYSSLTHGIGRMYYISNNELWKSNGTPESTIKLKAFTSLSNLTMVGTTLFFTADDGVSGVELWKSNGSPGSTVRVKDIMPGAASSSPANLADINGVLFFAAYFKPAGIELWKSDGTSEGTVMIKDLANGRANSSPKNIVNVNGTAYFSANNGMNGFELWKSDGTFSNTAMIQDIYSGKSSGDPQWLTASNGKLYFTAYNPSTGTELWTTDGTKEGTIQLEDIRPGSRSSTPENLIDIKGQLLFTAHDGKHGYELWKSDGTKEGTVIVKDMNPGGVGSYSTKGPEAHFTNINGLLYFIASRDNSLFIYRSDGTESGTVIIQQAFGAYSSEPQPEFTYMNGNVYFFNAPSEYDDLILYKMPYNGTNPTHVISLTTPEADYSSDYPQKPNEMIHFYNNLYFFGRFGINEALYGGGFEFIKSDGTHEGTVSVHDTFVPTLGSDPREMITVNGIVYMRTYTYLSYTPGLYATNGTPEGTFQIAEDQYQYEWEAVGDQLYFVTENWDVNAGYRWLLWRTAGTPATTVLIKEGAPDSEQTNMPSALAAAGEILYYRTDAGNLWKTDGTPEGTIMIRDLHKINSITSAGNGVYILANNSGDELELWKCDSNGLELVGGLGRGYSQEEPDPYHNFHHTAVIGNSFYFTANIFPNGQQLWHSDGTPTGTYSILGSTGDFDQYYIQSLMVLGDKLYFNAEDANNNYVNSLYYVNSTVSPLKVKDLSSPITLFTTFNNQLILFGETEVYASDGTEEGTVVLTTLDYSFLHDYTIVGDYLYFNSFDGEYLWRTNGTPCGTYTVDIGATMPFAMEAIGNNLIFGGHTLATGREPHVYRNINSVSGTPPCENAPVFASANTSGKSNNEAPMAYPNPFNGNFTLRIEDGKNEAVNVAVFTSYGMPVENYSGIRTNTDHALGASWPSGIYIVKVKTADKNITYQVVKK